MACGWDRPVPEVVEGARSTGCRVAVFTVFRVVGAGRQAEGSAAGHPSAASRPELIHPFTDCARRSSAAWCAWSPHVAVSHHRRAPGPALGLTLPVRVLLVAVYWRTNLTVRQLGPLFGVSHSAVHRVIDTVGPLLA